MLLKLVLIFISINAHAGVTQPSSKEDLIASTLLVEKKEAVKTLTLGLVDGESDDQASVVTARFNLNLPSEVPMIEDHGTFLQVKLPGVLIPESGKFSEVKSPYITKIASFQVNENTGALRLFLNSDAAVVKQATKIEVLGDRLLISLDHNKLAQLVAKPTEDKIEGKNSDKSIDKEAAQFIKKAEVKSEILEQEKKLEKVPELNVGSSLQSLQLGEKMTAATAFSAVMIVGFLGMLTFRRLRRKSFDFDKQEDEQASIPVKMRLLSSMAVVGKQRLSLVQVGDQQILLSVSPESISYIATIPKKGQSFGEHLMTENLGPANPRLQQTAQPQALPVRQAPPKLRSPTIPSQPSALSRGTAQPQAGLQPQRALNSTVSRQPAASQQPDANLVPHSQYEDISRAIRERLKKLPHI